MVGDGFREWGARLAAPLAFFLAATILIVLVHGALSSDDRGATGTTPTATQSVDTTGNGSTTTGERPRHKKHAKRFYEIQPGDTLATIATRYGTTVTELETLNPGVDPAALTVGERIRIR